MQRHTVYLCLETALHVSGGKPTTTTTAVIAAGTAAGTAASAGTAATAAATMQRHMVYLYLEIALQHVSGGTSTHHQECRQLYLQHLVFAIPLLLPAAIVEELEERVPTLPR